MSLELLRPDLQGAADPASRAKLRGSWFEIDLGAIRHNYRQLRQQLSDHVKVYACLKRNAYGCGAGPVAQALAGENVDGFAVASMLDAEVIRAAGVIQPILLYPGPVPWAASRIAALGLTITISSLDELAQWQSAIARPRVFIKIDLGFFRAGATPAEAVNLLQQAMLMREVTVEGIYAHMSELPGSGPSDAQKQLSRMQGVLAELDCAGLRRPELVMMSSTEGVLTYPEMDFDAVDPGALFVGLPESDNPVRQVALRPALSAICTTLVSAKRIDASLGPAPDVMGVKAGMAIGVIGMGWGDGLPRKLAGDAFALIRGKRVRLLPPAHLEHLRIDLTDVPEARFGDQVVLLGRQGGQTISHHEVASVWGTDFVGLYAGLRDHVPRVYV